MRAGAISRQTFGQKGAKIRNSGFSPGFPTNRGKTSIRAVGLPRHIRRLARGIAFQQPPNLVPPLPVDQFRRRRAGRDDFRHRQCNDCQARYTRSWRRQQTLGAVEQFVGRGHLLASRPEAALRLVERMLLRFRGPGGFARAWWANYRQAVQLGHCRVAYQHLKTVFQLVRLLGRDSAETPGHREPDRRAEKVLDLLQRIAVSEGSQGPIVYEYAELTVWFSEEGLPAEQPERLLVRRSLGQEPELKYHRSNAPPDIPLKQVASQRALRWTIEQDIQAGKGEGGLDEYETRGWIGWHHHTALSLLALLFLVLQRSRLGEKRAANERPPGARDPQTPRRHPPLGRSRNPRVVQLATGSKPHRKTLPRTTTPRRTAAAK
jgi:hypothetical protein